MELYLYWFLEFREKGSFMLFSMQKLRILQSLPAVKQLNQPYAVSAFKSWKATGIPHFTSRSKLKFLTNFIEDYILTKVGKTFLLCNC
jgi:hypothetical protein